MNNNCPLGWKVVMLMADLTVNLLALPPGGGEALLLVHHISHCDRLVPALLLGHSAAHLLGLGPALLPWLVPALAVGIANLLRDGGALFLDDGGADLLECGAALTPRLGPGDGDLDRLAVGGRLVPALLLPDRLADGSDENAGQGRANEAQSEDDDLHD